MNDFKGRHLTGEKRMIKRAFDVGPCIITEAVEMIERDLTA